MKETEVFSSITKEMNFEFNNDKKIGHIRCQFGNTKQIANDFVPSADMKEKVATFDLDLKAINQTVNTLQFDWLVNYDTLEEMCEGDDWNKKETNYFLQGDKCNYWVRLNPFGTNEYNCYIHIYHN